MAEKKSIKYRVKTEFLTKVKPPQDDIFRVVNDQHAWYVQHQNASRGTYSTSDSVGHFVAFEALSAEDASARFEDIAEVENYGSCECCGPRWYDYFSEYKPDERVKHGQLRWRGLVLSGPDIEGIEDPYAWILQPYEGSWGCTDDFEYINLVAHYVNGAKVRFTYIPVEDPAAAEDCQ